MPYKPNMPIVGNTLICGTCKYQQPQINFVKCKRCGCDLGAPNVNEVSTALETAALENRYKDAINYTVASGNEKVLNGFEDYFQKNAHAVININIHALSDWLLRDDAYKNYYRLTDTGIRDIASPENDRKRNIIDGFLFGSYGSDMIFAALSLKRQGLHSYGECTVVLEDDVIASRATVMEENSYNFAEKHGINFDKPQIPPGYRATWENKMKLAVSKKYLQFHEPFTDGDFQDWVLMCDGDRRNDDFIEVHVFGELSELAVNSMSIPSGRTRKVNLEIEKIEEKYPGKVFIV